MSTNSYSVPEQAKLVFQQGILNNPLISNDVPKEVASFGQKVRFVGSDAPTVPINWRFAESVSALKGFEAVLVMSLLKRKYDVVVEEVSINTSACAISSTIFILLTVIQGSCSAFFHVHAALDN
jgi:hypothetical protein